MHRQASRSTVNSDAIDCLVNTNDLALENEELNQKHEQRRFNKAIYLKREKHVFSFLF
jgi:hypothetical protein